MVYHLVYMELVMSLLVDVITLGGVSVEPEVAGVDIRTWVVNEVLSTVQVYMQSMPISAASTQHSEVLPQCSGLELTNL